MLIEKKKSQKKDRRLGTKSNLVQKKGLSLIEKSLTLAALVNYKTYIKFINYKTVQLKIDI